MIATAANIIISSGSITNAVIAAAALLGGGGVVGYLRGQRKAGARDAEIDEAVQIVRADPAAKPPKPDLGVRVDQLAGQVQVVVDNMSRNGGKSLRDDIDRTEKKVDKVDAKVDAVNSKLDQFIGEMRAARRADK